MKNFAALHKKILEGKPPYLTMYFVFKNEETPFTPIIRLVDIDKSVREDLATKFTLFLAGYSDRDLSVGNVSTADERHYDAFIFDIALVSPLEQLEELLNKPDVDKYEYSKDGKRKLDGYIFIMGNDKVKFSFYKEHYPMDAIRRDTYAIFGRSGSRFVSVPDEEIFKLNSKIDFLLYDKVLYVLNEKVMESNFKIHNVLKKKAEKVVDVLNKMSLVENPEYLNQLISEKPAFARKVLRVNADSPVIKLPFKDIKNFITRHPHLNGKLTYNKKGDRIKLDTKVSATLFVKLMDDDFLKSELSQQLYSSISKDRLVDTANTDKTASGSKK
ncbi:MAG: DUF4868 domain-containing protein [Cyclobacteriaceae bacterium]|nr:DUF4868 domain-containing protein [Cyclobacteriaceae bacterium]